MAGRIRCHLTYANVGVTIALVLCVGGFAVAAIPGPNGVIRGCFNKRSGALRVIDTGRSCRRGERALSWNQKGLRGATGAAGTTGGAGKPGDKGSDAQFAGATAGGDLTGTFPAPSIAPNAVGGAEVEDGTITGAEVDESTLGQVPDAAKLGGVNASQYARDSFGAFTGITAPNSGSSSFGGGVQINVTCTSGPAGNKFAVLNNTNSNMEVWIDDSRGLTPTTYLQTLPDGGSIDSDVDTALSTTRRVIINTIAAGKFTSTTMTLVRRSVSQCSAFLHTFT